MRFVFVIVKKVLRFEKKVVSLSNHFTKIRKIFQLIVHNKKKFVYYVFFLYLCELMPQQK